MPSKINMPDIFCCDICGKPFLSEEKASECEKKGIQLPRIFLGDDILISSRVSSIKDTKAKILQAKIYPILRRPHDGAIIEFLAETKTGERTWVRDYNSYTKSLSMIILPSWAVYLQAVHENLKTHPDDNLQVLEEALGLSRRTKEKILKMIEQV